MNFVRLLPALPLFALALCATASAASDITTPEQLFPQLDAILKQSVAQSPRMISRALDLEMAEEGRIAARAAMLPNMAGSYRYYLTSDERADMPDGRVKTDKQYYDFNITQPLFYWGERKNTARMGEIRENMASGQYRDAYRLFVLDVRSRYFRLILGKVRLARAEYLRDYTAKQQKQAEARLEKKEISDAQIFAIRLDAERSLIGAERARFDFETDKAAFARITGGTVLLDSQIPDLIPPVPDQQAAVERALAGFLAQKDPLTADADQLRQNIDLERLNLSIQKTRLRPKFNLVAGINQDEQSYTVNVAQKYRVQSLYGGVSLYWTIFDGFSAGAAIRSSNARVRQLEGDYRQLTTQLAQQAQTQARIIGFAVRNSAINDRLSEAGESGLKTRREEFQRGVISESAVDVAQLDVYLNNYSAFEARADYFNQLSEFLGTIAEDPVLANLPKTP